MLAQNETKNIYEEHLLELKRWKEEQMKHFQRIEEQRRACLDADKQRFDALIKNQSLLKQSSNKFTRNPIISSAGMAVISNLDKSNKSTSSKEMEKANEPSTSKEAVAVAIQKVSVVEDPLPGPSGSFEDAIQQQMQKLQMQGKSESNKTNKPKPKQPFLRKGDGHKRFTMKKNSKKTVPLQTHQIMEPPVKLKLKPPVQSKKIDAASKAQLSVPYELVLSQKQKNVAQNEHVPQINNSNRFACSRREKEDRELAEFELLENATQNSSFCSDSSLVTGVLNKNFVKENLARSSPEPIQLREDTDTEDLGQFLNELQIQKKHLKQQLKEIDNFALECHSPLSVCLDSLEKERTLKNVRFATTSSSSGSSVLDSDLNTSVVKLCGPNTDVFYATNEPVNDLSSSEIEDPIVIHSKQSDQSLRARLIEKTNELQDEIAIYKRNNSQLTSLSKQREQEIESFRKKMKDFESSKDEELKKVDKEISEKRLQLRREKLTLERCRRFRKDQPDKKAREEISNLKQQVVSLQEEMKKQCFKSSCESKRLKKMLESAEQERDALRQEVETLKAEKGKLTESCQAKQKALKEIKVSQTVRNAEQRRIEQAPEVEVINEVVCNEECTVVKPHVRFNLEPSVYMKEPADVTSATPSEMVYSDRVEKVFSNGQKEICYASGTKKFISSDGQHRKYIYYNGDIKEDFPDQKSVYTFVDGTVETTLADGVQIYDYTNGQKEIYHKDGTVETLLLDRTKVLLHPDGLYEIVKPDGMRMKLFSDVMEVIEFPLGDKEYRTADFVKHVFADGTTKTVFQSGIIETAYSDGRLRVKNKDGKIIVNV